MSNSLGEKIRRLRKEKDLTIEQLAEQTDSSKGYIWELENHDTRKPSAEKLIKIAAILNVDIEFLQKKLNVEVLEKAREVYKNGKYDLKKAMLKMFNNVGGWTTVADIIIGTIDENESIRNLSLTAFAFHICK